MGKCCCNLKCGLITLGIIGAIFIIIGGISVTVFDIIFENIIVQEGTIAEGTIAYDAWKVVTTPTYLSYWFYNVTNAEEFLAQKTGEYVPPRLEEVGPYVFREYYEKDNIEFLRDTNPEEVFFRQTVVLIFEPELSVGPLTDQVTTLNIIAASIAPIVEYLYDTELNSSVPDDLYRVINQLYNQVETKLLFTKPAGDLLFGFQDDLYDLLVGIIENAIAGADLPDRFGLFSTSNNSDGWFNYTVYTGKKNRPDLINVITSYNNEMELDYWGSKECNMINGTDGTTSPPFMKKEEKIYFFVDDVCRSLYATFVEEVEVKKIPAWKYAIPPEIFAGPLKNPDNKCFCPNPDEPLCAHDGAISIQSCQLGAPVVISLPHFLNGDDYYLGFLDGVSPPVDEEHEVSLVYEPNTGQAIKVDKRLQINFGLRYNPQIDVLSQIEETIVFPIVWLNESALIGDEDADLLYGLLVVPADIVYILQIVFCVVGSIMFATPFVYYLIKSLGGREMKSDTKYKMEDSPKTKQLSSYYSYDNNSQDNAAYDNYSADKNKSSKKTEKF